MIIYLYSHCMYCFLNSNRNRRLETQNAPKHKQIVNLLENLFSFISQFTPPLFLFDKDAYCLLLNANARKKKKKNGGKKLISAIFPQKKSPTKKWCLSFALTKQVACDFNICRFPIGQIFLLHPLIQFLVSLRDSTRWAEKMFVGQSNWIWAGQKFFFFCLWSNELVLFVGEK